MMVDLGRVTVREAREIIDAVKDGNPELARVLQRRLDLAMGFGTWPRGGRALDQMFGRAR